jgi:hypothetical protein
MLRRLNKRDGNIIEDWKRGQNKGEVRDTFAWTEKKHYLSIKFRRIARWSFLYKQYGNEAEDEDVRLVTAEV